MFSFSFFRTQALEPKENIDEKHHTTNNYSTFLGTWHVGVSISSGITQPLRKGKGRGWATAVGNSNFSTMDYCSTVELASAAKLRQYSLRSPIKGKGSSQDMPRTLLLTESTIKEYKATTSRHQVYWLV